MLKGITIFTPVKQNHMTRPEQPEPHGRFKTMQTLQTPSGNTFEYCLDSDSSDCDVSNEIESAYDVMYDLFSHFNDIFSPKK